MARSSPPVTTFRPSTTAHRWSGVVGESISALCAVGVRSDDEDRVKGESLVVDLGPGRIERRAPLPFPVCCVGGTADDPLFVDAPGRALWRLVDGKPVKLRDGVVALEGLLVLDARGEVDVFDGAGLKPIATGARGIACGVVVGDETLTLVGDRGETLETRAFKIPGQVKAAHRHGRHVAVYIDTTLHTLDLETGAHHTFAGPAEAHCLARASDRWFIGCTLGGLLTLDDGDDTIRVFRPSLRAHQILRLKDGFVAVSDLSIAVSDDGHEWLGRDLAGLVRLFDTR